MISHKVAGQNFDQYVLSDPNRPNLQRNKLYIQPVGEFTRAQNTLIRST